MLVLSRKRWEIIRIADDITIQVLEIRSYVVRLGITAPGRTVDRQEVWIRIQEEKQRASDHKSKGRDYQGASEEKEAIRDRPDWPD